MVAAATRMGACTYRDYEEALTYYEYDPLGLDCPHPLYHIESYVPPTLSLPPFLYHPGCEKSYGKS